MVGTAGGHVESTGLARMALQSMDHVDNLEALADELVRETEAANGEPLPRRRRPPLLSTSTHWSR